MTQYLTNSVREKFSNIFLWTQYSSQALNVDVVTKWATSVPKFSTIRVNTLKYSVEDVVSIVSSIIIQLANSYGLTCPAVHKHPLLDDCIIIESWDINQLDLSKKQHEVIIDSACGISVLKGAHVYAPGIMAMKPDVKVNTPVSVFADLAMKCTKGLKTLFEHDGKLFVGNGVACMNRYQLFDNQSRAKGLAIKMNNPASGLVIPSLPPDLGIYQNLPSMVCVHLLSPKAGDCILDMCASPGNKTTHIAALVKNEADIYAIDRNAAKVKSIEDNCSKLGVTCVKSVIGDSTHLSSRYTNDDVPRFPDEYFDRILLDAPCSGLGLRPMLRTDLQNERALLRFSAIQKKLFNNAYDLLKRNGILVYSTCTILCEENECLVSWALNKYSDLELVDDLPRLGAFGLSGCGLTEEQRRSVQKFGPDESNQTIGFFIAKFRKKNAVL